VPINFQDFPFLAEGSGHGYDLIQRLEEKSEGAWRPSPGSVYPTLQLLEDEGLVAIVKESGRKMAHLTEAGTTRRASLHLVAGAENLRAFDRGGEY
jgi:DNA-binding PadR family transcriptional regulator